MTTTLAELLKDSAYKLAQFKPEQIQALETGITLKESGKKEAPYVNCLVRGKPVRLTPEEAVRQLYVMVLRDDLGYLKEIAIVQPSDGAPMVASTEFIVLRPKSTNTLPIEALLVYLRSALPQLVFKWSQDGSNHPRFDERELLRLPVPRVLIAQADDYVLAVRAMIAARERATQLLDAAKRAVEIAIEDSETAALAYLEGVNP